MIPRRTGNALCALLLVALPALAAGEATLSASTDVRELPLDDTLVLRITAKFASRDESGELDIPVFADFDVVNRARSEQMSFSFGGGASSMARTVITEITLTPKRAGDLTIEPVKLEYRGKKLQTEPIAIHVLPPGQAVPGGSGPDPRADAADPFADVHPGQRDLLLRASVDDDHPFVGQQVTYSLFLLARTNVSSIEKLVSPRLDGFWSVDVEAPQQLVPEQRILDGVPYTSYLLRRRALFPLRAGRATIDPAEVQVLTGFGMLFSRGTSRRSSQPLQIEVQPLPPGKPPGFDAGNVGQWTLTATADPAAVGVGQPITFRLVASGRGNVRDLRLPKLPEIPGVRAYDATTSDKESIERGRVNGTRTIEQLLVPERTGALEIPALSMDVFDPVLKQYKTLKTERIPLRVTPAEGAQAAAASVSQNLLSAGGVRPIRLRLSTVDRTAPPWTQPWFWPLLGIPPFGVAVGLGFAGLRRLLQIDPGEKRVKLARGAAAKRLKGARALLQRGESLAFYAEVARAVTGYLLDKQGIAAAGLTREELAAALRARGHGEETVRRLVRVLDDCDRARFAPGSGEAPAREAMLGRADQVLNELDRGRA